jgi:hypothetical protein
MRSVAADQPERYADPEEQAPRPRWPERFLEFSDAHNARDGFILANGAKSGQSCTMKVSEDASEQVAEQGIAKDETLKKSILARSKEFVEIGTEVYAKT